MVNGKREKAEGLRSMGAGGEWEEETKERS